MRVRAIVVLLLLAALLGAPPRASAATNVLLDPAVSPTSGVAGTVFTFRVRYEGSFGAVAVTTTIAGLSLPMVRTAGTASAGSWAAASALPAGTWRPTFAAVASQGNQPTLLGPSVVVETLVPTAEPTDAPVGVAPTPVEAAPTSSGRSAPAEGGTAPTATPAPAAPVATGAPVAAPTPTGSPTEPGPGVPGPTDAASGAATPAGITTPGGSAGGGTDTGGGQGLPGEAPSLAPSGDGSVSTGPTPAGSRGPRGSEPAGHGLPSGLGDGADSATEVGAVLVIGLSGVAAVALVGLAVLLARRRRERDEAGAVVATSDPALEPTPEERRPSRRASIDLPDDPIVVAMGLGRDEPGMRRPRDRRPD